MPSFCVVSNCELKYTHSENVSFHKFPLHDESLLKEWIKFTDRGADWRPSRWSSICSRHFVNSDFREFLSRKCLKKNAIPSVVTKNNISFETYHIADQSSTANSGDEDVSECTDDKDTESTTNVQRNVSEKMQLICCRLCGDRIEGCRAPSVNFRIDDQDVGEMLRKCLPSISISSRHSADHLNSICTDCVAHLRRYSDFVDKVMKFQQDFDRANNADTSLEHMIFESRGSQSTSTSNSTLFIKQEPINVKQEILDSSNKKPPEVLNVMKPSLVPSTSTNTHLVAPNSSYQRINVVEQSLIHWTRICANTFCPHCERIFINQAEMKSHACAGNQPLNIDRIEPMNGASNNNNCEIMEIITLNNPVSFIDLAEDEYATAEQTAAAVCKKEYFVDGERRERVDIEHAYAKRSAIAAASSACKLKQEIEMNYECEPMEGDVFDSAPDNDNTALLPPPPEPVDVTSATQECNFICSKCGQEFSTNRALVDHSKKMHSLKNRICAICSAEFKSTYEYLLHKNKVHVSGHQCQRCKRKFATHLALKIHERHSCSIDSMDFYYSCRYCGKFMQNRIKMKEHLRICAQNPKSKDPKAPISTSNIQNEVEICDAKAYDCHRCHRSFRKEINFQRHTRNQCRRKYPKSDSNTIASSEHSSEIVGVIPIPTASFSSESSHVTSESNTITELHAKVAKPESNNNRLPCGKYVCEVCSKLFGAYANWKQHKTTHEIEKKFVCVLCPKRFKRISGLNQHVRGFHYKIKPFSCPICTYNYALKGDMLRCRHSSLKKDAAAVNAHQ